MRYRDLDRVMNDPATFSSARGGIILEEMEPDALEARRSMMETDPPRHTRMRKIVSPLFTPRAIREYEPFCRDLARAVLDRALPLGEFDFVDEISRQLPIRVLARILGVPDEDTDRLIAWGDRMIGNMDPEYADLLVDRDDTSAYRHHRGGPGWAAGPRGRQGRGLVHLGQPRRGGLPRPRPVRRHPDTESGGRVRQRRPALLPGRPPGAHGDPGDVRRAPPPPARHRADRPGPQAAVELHQRREAHAGAGPGGLSYPLPW